MDWTRNKLHNVELSDATYPALGNLVWVFLRFGIFVWRFSRTQISFLDVKPPDAFLSALILRTLGKLHQMNPYDFGCVVHTMVYFEYPIPEEWYREAIEYFETRISDFTSAPSLCFVIQSLVKQETMKASIFEMNCRKGYKPNKALMKESCELVTGASTHIELSHIVNFLWACVQSGYRPVSLFDKASEIKSKSSIILFFQAFGTTRPSYGRENSSKCHVWTCLGICFVSLDSYRNAESFSVGELRSNVGNEAIIFLGQVSHE